MHSRSARAARGAVVALIATLVAAFSHTLAGGVPPSVFGLTASLVLSIAACTLLTGRTLSLPRLTASVAVSQAMFHALFGTLGTPTAVAHEHAPTLADAPASAEHAEMLLAHIAAGLVTLVVLRYSERAFWGVRETARLLLARLTVAPLPVVPHRSRPAVTAPTPWRDLGVLFSAMRYRGPPALNGAR